MVPISDGSPFVPLQLTPEHKRELECTAKRLVQEQLQLLQAHLQQDGGGVDLIYWKCMRQRDDVRVYRERRSARGPAEPPTPPTSGDSTECATLLALGTIPGDLDDVMYGVCSPTLDEMRIKASYSGDSIVDAMVLAVLVTPSVAEPFHSLVVKWNVSGRSTLLRKVVKDRDVVYLEATGLVRLPDGERVGYHVLQSVEFPQTGKLDDIAREHVSVCCLFHQKTPYNVELFARSRVEPSRNLGRSAAIKSAAEGIFHSLKAVHCAEMKKLAWATRRRGAKSRRVDRRNSVVEPFCKTCQKRPLVGGASMKRPTTCGVCCERLCRSCRVRKKLSFLDTYHQVVRMPTSLCGQCVTEVLKKCAFIVASDEVSVGDGFVLGSGITSRTSTTPTLWQRRSRRQGDGYAKE